MGSKMSNKKQNSGLQPINNTIAELFEKGRSTITEHLKKIFEDAVPIAIGRMKIQYVGISDTLLKLENSQYINN